MRTKDDQTLSLRPRRSRDEDVPLDTHLFLVIHATRPRNPAARFCLGELDEVRIGRGSERRVELASAGATRRMSIAIDDGWMSSNHAVLLRDEAGWRIVDQQSKNGTLVNGARQRDVQLVDGDIVEIGQTFFVFRAELPTPAASLPRLFADQLAIPAGMATMVPELAARFDALRRIAASKSSIVLRGASGTGKEMLARAVHELSGRRGPFVAVNCAALPEQLVESELFGFIKGAFSGADRDREGLIAAAGGGTLFLDEIGDLPLSAQAKLLRALQEQEVRPVGAVAPQPVDLRVVAATHRDLEQLVTAGRFREDLLARLGGEFELPALSQRREDLGLLIGALLVRIEDPRARDAGLTGDAVHALLDYAWPRNVRELQKVLERAIALSGGSDVEISHLPDELRAVPARRSQPAMSNPLSDSDRERRDHIIALLREHGGNITAVARAMGKVRSQVQRWIKRYGIDVEPR